MVIAAPPGDGATRRPHAGRTWSPRRTRPRTAGRATRSGRGDTLIGLAATVPHEAAHARRQERHPRRGTTSWAGPRIQRAAHLGAAAKAASAAPSRPARRTSCAAARPSPASRPATAPPSPPCSRPTASRPAPSSTPASGSSSAAAAVQGDRRPRHQPRTAYRVRAGDTLLGIAARHRTVVGPRQRQRISSRAPIYPGQRLASGARPRQVERRRPGAQHVQRREVPPDRRPRPRPATARSSPGARCPAAARPRRSSARPPAGTASTPGWPWRSSMQESGWNQRAGLRRQRRRHHAGHPVRRQWASQPRRAQAGPARPRGQHHRGRRHAAGPARSMASIEDQADRRPTTRASASVQHARHVHRHQGLRRATSRRSRADVTHGGIE